MKRVLKRSIRILLGLFFLFQIYLSVRLYWLVSCAIPTYSMSPTLVGGDYIFASMQIPGRRIYEEDPSRPGHYLIHRKNGVRDIRKGDVVVFNFPYAENEKEMVLNKKTYYCKRCVALPGERYRWANGKDTKEIYLPKANDILQIDSTNYNDYYKCIEYETGLTVKIDKGEKIYMGDSLLTSFRFRHNYYFMRGDNTNDSYDSRYWGILPDDFILGVGQCIWFSKDPQSKQIRWNRIFKKI